MWIDDLDEWFADADPPVVLQVGVEQLEVCAQKFDDLSVTWNTIDLSIRPIACVD